jgi:hypothetical protein
MSRPNCLLLSSRLLSSRRLIGTSTGCCRCCLPRGCLHRLCRPRGFSFGPSTAIASAPAASSATLALATGAAFPRRTVLARLIAVGALLHALALIGTVLALRPLSALRAFRPLSTLAPLPALRTLACNHTFRARGMLRGCRLTTAPATLLLRAALAALTAPRPVRAFRTFRPLASLLPGRAPALVRSGPRAR